MEPFVKLQSTIIPLPIRNIDTDQIIPARYLKVTDKAGLGDGLFHDWRYDDDGNPEPDFVLNQPEHQKAKMLLVEDNFGCGSSREHAPWALFDWGIRAIISTSFADIFYNNALKNGLLPVVVDPDTHQSLFDLVEEAPRVEITIDLESQTIQLPGETVITFPVDQFSRRCLLNGFDQLGYIRSFEDQINAFENR